VCVYSVFVLSCVQIAALRRADSPPRSLTECVKCQATEKAVKFQQRAVELQIDRYTDTQNAGVCKASRISFVKMYRIGSVVQTLKLLLNCYSN
jgi:hypothetical protein